MFLGLNLVIDQLKLSQDRADKDHLDILEDVVSACDVAVKLLVRRWSCGGCVMVVHMGRSDEYFVIVHCHSPHSFSYPCHPFPQDELLYYDKLNSGQFHLSHDVLNPVDIVAETFEMFKPQARSKHIHLKLKNGKCQRWNCYSTD